MKLVDYVKFNEGLKLVAYWDKIGKKWTIGYGCTGPLIVEGTKWTQADAEAAVEMRCALAQQDVVTVIGKDTWLALNPVRRVVLGDMAYQMGAHGLAKFIRTIAAVKASEWDKASVAILQSLYAEQTPNRARRNASMMLTGLPTFG